MASTRAVKLTSDVFALPPPSALTALSLGYRSALADILFTSTVVSYGIHGEEHRRFEFVGEYLDSIVALDPHFCQTYRYADTFIIYQAEGTPGPDEVRHAQRLLERGLEMCPYDAALWLSAGQFMAFIGTQFLTDEREKEQLRSEGAKTLARAAELGSDNQNLQWQATAAAGIFTREGNREAAIAFLERVYSVTDDEQLKANVAAKLDALREEQRASRAKRRADAFNELWRRDLPFVSRTKLLVLGPPFEAPRCSGGDRPANRCAQSWLDWGAAQTDQPMSRRH
ncbi:MAG TPA: hypothetical protein VF881_03090 [Polyangiaceae bacterium]